MVLAVANLISLATKWILIRWLIKRMDLESEAKSPVQHYMWECLNDKFVVDTQVWDRVLRRKPSSSGHLLGGGLGDDGGNGASSRRRWNRIVHDMTVVAGATAAVEFGWYALATGIDPWRVLAANLDVAFGFRPAVWVGIAGLGVVALRVGAGVFKPRSRRARMMAGQVTSGEAA